MADLNTIADALAAAAAVATSLAGEPLTGYAEPTEAPQSPAVECVFVGRVPVDMCGGQQQTWAVELSVPADAPGWSETGREMRAWLDVEGPHSVEAAIIADRTLGGIVDTLAISGVEGARLVPFGDARRWLGRLTVEIWT